MSLHMLFLFHPLVLDLLGSHELLVWVCNSHFLCVCLFMCLLHPLACLSFCPQMAGPSGIVLL